MEFMQFFINSALIKSAVLKVIFFGFDRIMALNSALVNFLIVRYLFVSRAVLHMNAHPITLFRFLSQTVTSAVFYQVGFALDLDNWWWPGWSDRSEIIVTRRHISLTGRGSFGASFWFSFGLILSLLYQIGFHIGVHIQLEFEARCNWSPMRFITASKLTPAGILGPSSLLGRLVFNIF